jgi:uncharacterized protein (TIGR03437 family)
LNWVTCRLLFLILAGLLPVQASYILVGWNNLGMHCMDSDYSIFSILPPYNTIQAQLIGPSGQLVKNPAGITVTYEAIADASGSINSSSVGKSGFWNYSAALYGSALAPDTGLAGTSMPGSKNTPQSAAFDAVRRVFGAEGVPLTPYDDEGVKNFYPMMRLVARDGSGALLASSDIVLPVSDEMSCRACHSSFSNDSAKPSAGWVNQADGEKDYRLNVLRLHDERERANPQFVSALAAMGYNSGGLYATVAQSSRPVLCAGCHGSNALPGTGQAGIKPLTEATHGLHAGVKLPGTSATLDATANRSACYGCHPGSITRCLRGVMGNAVASNGTVEIQCQECHGSMSEVGAVGRQGWLDEPTCQNCHTGTATRNNGQIRYTTAFTAPGQRRQPVDLTFATNPDTPLPGVSLYRMSSGHGALQCEACHGSTHAEYPTSHSSDNLQSQRIQGHSGMLSECSACHAAVPSTVTGGPHGMHPVGQAWVSVHDNAAEGNASQCRVCHGIDYRGTELSRALGDRTVSAFGTKQFWRGFQIGCYTCHNGPGSERASSNAAPVVYDVAMQTDGPPVSVTLVATDANRDPLSLRIVTQPVHGLAGLNGAVVTYTPYPGSVGADSFRVAAWDGSTNSNLATVTVSLTKPAGSVGTLSSVSAASFKTGAVAAGSIVAGYGADLAPETRVAGSVPLPTPLGGAGIQIRDSHGFERFAPLFFVSPSQINYAVPGNTSDGAAQVTVIAADGTTNTGTLEVARVAPGLFTANFGGQGPAAAHAMTVRGSASSLALTFQCDVQGANCVTTPIDLGADTDDVFLILYGTGIRNRSDLAAVACSVGGVNAPVDYAGPQGAYYGLDQVNVKLPKSLRGRGEVDVVLMVDGVAANTVRVRIK